VTGTVAAVAVALAVAGVAGGLLWRLMTVPPASRGRSPAVLRASLALALLSVVAAAALVGQAASGGSVWGWVAFAAVAAIGVGSLVLWALHATS
jgi:hypothetical protein